MNLLKKNESVAVAALFDDEEEMPINMYNKENSLNRRFLLEMKPNVINKYLDYLKEQLLKHQAETIVEIGNSIDCIDNLKGFTLEELQEAEKNHNKLLESINCKGTSLLTRHENNFYTKIVLVRKNIEELDFIEVRVAVVGNVDAGKSTLLGVLTHNVLDDGRGHARQKLFRHKHEFESGRTSSVGNDIIGFDVYGDVVNKNNNHVARLDWINICRNSAKVITFIDLAGHEKYLRTTIFGMTGHIPHYTMLIVGSNAGVIGTTKEHLSLILSLQVPVFVVVTKIDMCPTNVLEKTLENLIKLMKSPGSRKMPILIHSVEQVVQAAQNFTSGKTCPIFQASNVKGTNLDLLKSFLNLLFVLRSNNDEKEVEFQIDDIYWVNGVGTCVSGTCLSGTVQINNALLLGPDSFGQFQLVTIKSIHRKRMPVSVIKSNQTASFALRKVDKKDVRKGMFLLSPTIHPVVCYEFEAEILILHHPTTIAPNYQAMVHAGSIRQTATIVSMSKVVLRTGDRDLIVLRFIKHPEYLRVGLRMVLREGRTKAVGTIKKIIPHAVGSGATNTQSQIQKIARIQAHTNKQKLCAPNQKNSLSCV